ncbi:hypothetical protein [Streptomyces sp. NPDC048636]|uniref:hypothetical protein n=1 Tax=Streptomyces sp. NPDC048636 TaxID=3155762 RepID=UPI003417D87D
MTSNAFAASLLELLALDRLVHTPDTAVGSPREREFLVRQAGYFDRMAEYDGEIAVLDSADAVHYAVHYAHLLLAHDREHGTTSGPIPAAAPCWHDSPRGYAQQEHRAWMHDHPDLHQRPRP